jgi:hypothetical protein
VTDPYGHILGFPDRRRYFLFKVTPQLYSRGCVAPRMEPGPLATRLRRRFPYVHGTKWTRTDTMPREGLETRSHYATWINATAAAGDGDCRRSAPTFHLYKQTDHKTLSRSRVGEVFTQRQNVRSSRAKLGSNLPRRDVSDSVRILMVKAVTKFSWELSVITSS